MSNLRKILGVLVLSLCISIASPSVVPFITTNTITVEAAKAKISKKKAVLIKGQSLTLSIKNNSKKVKWSTSDKKIATINSNGKIKAKKVGTTTITAKVGNKKYTCKVIVEQPKISDRNITLKKGESETIWLSGNTQKIKWTTSNKNVATVNSKGKITAKNTGTAKITAKVSTKTYTCTVTVKKSSNSEKELTMGQKNALALAKDYLDIMAFSYSGLIKQLQYEGFSTADATYAADNCGANWNEQAVRKAKEYLKIFSFSRSSLISQLKYEGFTDEQAEYAANTLGY